MRFFHRASAKPGRVLQEVRNIRPDLAGRIAALRRPGFPLQFLSPPAAGLRDFRFNPLRVLAGAYQKNPKQGKKTLRVFPL
jgi:hypothetical protein